MTKTSGLIKRRYPQRVAPNAADIAAMAVQGTGRHLSMSRPTAIYAAEKTVKKAPAVKKASAEEDLEGDEPKDEGVPAVDTELDEARRIMLDLIDALHKQPAVAAKP